MQVVKVTKNETGTYDADEEWNEIECVEAGTGDVLELQGDAYSSGDYELMEGCKLYKDADESLYTAFEQV
jgi:hypothetical protein